MKKLVGLVVVIAALILGSYYGMGVITERTLKKNIGMMSQSNGVKVDIEQYHRGWFDSKASLNWHLQAPAHEVTNQAGETTTVPAQDIQMLMPLDICHGPIIFVNSKFMFGLGYAHSDVNLPQPYADQFKQDYTAESTAPKLSMTIYVSFINKSTFNLSVPGFKLISKEGSAKFEWFGLTSELAVSSRGNNISGDVSIAGLSLIKDAMSAMVTHVVSDYDFHRTSLGLYLGDANLKLSSALIKQDEKVTALKKLALHSSSDIQNGLFNSHFKATLETFAVNHKVYGPALLELSITNLDAVTLAKINDQSNSMKQGPDAERQHAILSLLPELSKLVSKGAGIELSEFSVVMPEGKMSGSMLFSLPGTTVDNPFQLIQKIKGQGKFLCSEAVLKQLMTDSVKRDLQQQAASQASVIEPVPADAASAVPAPVAETPAVPVVDVNQQAMTKANEKLTTMAQSGLLSLHGTDYVIEFKLAEGQLSVNGKPFNPAMMKY